MTVRAFFRRENRLRKRADFRAVHKDGKAFGSRPFVIRVIKNSYDSTRVGFSISSRIIRTAARRNRIRRVLREVFRINQRAIKKGYDIVIIVRSDPPKAFSFLDAQNALLSLLNNAGLIISNE